ncbi:CPBP family intramembrane glutamic endopeptidase [Psychrobacter phenylpyruvicus]|uniref:CAAX amino terminal protease self- immunity n=1 Tax=Psychrobacter phenylpyruvicus TaxID=29432 RepID=A0A379LI80_9GAMM|nr:CPBP family intramembrane glutamic endopeptidase [Psychrobacter phenylpyruvicus]SUD90276.1 CAAX amino terminal protease self- immunity [Psychrobacter phenylpyruvicus]
MFNKSATKPVPENTEAVQPHKLFTKLGVVLLFVGIIGLFLALQLLGIYLFAPVVFNDFPLTSAQRFGMGSFDGTVTSYAMIFTLVVLLVIIYAIVRGRIHSVSSQSSVIPAMDDGEATSTGARYGVADYLGLKPFPFNIAMGFIGLWLLFVISTETLTYILDKDPTAFVDVLYDSANPKWLLIVTMVIVAPIYEEVMFRGILWSAVREQFVGSKGAWVATISTSILFSIIHLQYEFYEMSVIFILAMLLGYARSRSGSLYVPILLHIINNGVAMWMYLIVN